MLMEFLSNVRRNHALEHATVSLLLARLGPDLRLIGRATGDGFYIYGDVPSDVLASCAKEGLERLQRGESFWAVTPLCGTNIATAGIMASMATLAVVGNGPVKDKRGSAMMAGIIAVLLAQPIGRLIQRYITTSPELSGVEIVSIEARGKGRSHKVRTRRLTASPAL